MRRACGQFCCVSGNISGRVKKGFLLCLGWKTASFFSTFEAFYKCVCFYKLPSVSSLATASAEGPVEVEEAGAACQGLSVCRSRKLQTRPAS